MRYETLFPQELQEILAKTPIAYIPFGPLEYHDAHLPFGLDAMKAHDICLRTCQLTGGVVLPPVYLSTNSLYWYSGTLDAPLDLVRGVVRTLLSELKRQGFKTVVVASGHGAMDQNLSFKQEAEAATTQDFKVISTIEWEFVPEQGYLGEHAAKWETALFMEQFPDLVKMERLKDTPLDQLHGIYGEDPRLTSSRALGKKTIDLIVERLATEVREVAAGAIPRNAERHQNWVSTAWPEPLEMVEKSLRLVENGFQFSFYNPHLKSRYITSIQIMIAGKPIDLQAVTLYNRKENKVLACHQIHALYGFYIRRLQQCELVITGYPLPEVREIAVEFEYGGVNRSQMINKG